MTSVRTRYTICDQTGQIVRTTFAYDTARTYLGRSKWAVTSEVI